MFIFYLVCLFIYFFRHTSVFISINFRLFSHLSIYLLSIYLSIHLCINVDLVFLSTIFFIKILRFFFIFWFLFFVHLIHLFLQYMFGFERYLFLLYVILLLAVIQCNFALHNRIITIQIQYIYRLKCLV